MPYKGKNVLVMEPPPGPTAERSVLVVDDDAVTNWCLHDQLERHGMNAQAVLNGESALTVLGMKSYDALVLDVYMPGIDGIDLLRRFRRDGGKGVPVLIVTAGKVEALADDLKDLGPVEILSKPYTFDQILTKLRSLWGMT